MLHPNFTEYERRIDNFLLDEMTIEERNQFEEDLTTDPALNEQFQWTQLIAAGLRWMLGEDIKETLKTISNETQNNS